MQRWEYFTTHLEANIEQFPPPPSDHISGGEKGRYSPHSLIAQLNRLGDQGWELMSIEPVAVGKHEDVVRPDANAGRWGRHYFCCFKRPVP